MMKWLMVLSMIFASGLYAADTSPVVTIDGKTWTYAELYEANKAKMYELEEQRYEQITQIAYDMYLQNYWSDLAKKKRMTVDAAKKWYLEKNSKVSNSELNKTFEQLKNHPQLAGKTDKQKKDEIRNYLAGQAQGTAQRALIDEAQKKGKIKILLARPQEPVYEIAFRKEDIPRFGPATSDIKPISCKADDCVTIFEYGDFQCPACQAASEAGRQVLEAYKGKVRWVLRDFPLSFHPRAKPTAIAAQCGAEQGKYWDFYDFFYKEKKLSDEDITAFAKDRLKLDMNKFNKCLKSPAAAAVVDWNYNQGQSIGINGTPTFFVNGRKLGGVTQFNRFKEVIDDELKKAKKG